MNNKSQCKDQKKTRSQKTATAKLVKRADVQAMAGTTEYTGTTPRFTSSRMYEMRIAESLDIVTDAGSIKKQFDTRPPDAPRYQSARVTVEAGKFVFAHVDHQEHIVYFVSISDDLRTMAMESGPKGTE